MRHYLGMINTLRTVPALLPLLWLTAFICGLYFNNDWQLELFGLSIGACFIWGMIHLWRGAGAPGGVIVPRSRTLMFMALFWLLVLLSVSWSAIPYISLMGFCFFSVLPITLFGFVMFSDRRAMVLTAYALAGVMAVMAVWAMVQFFVFNELYEGRARHPLADPNSLGALFNLALFPAMGWMMAAPDKRQSAMGLLLSILLTGGLMATGSRGAFLAAVITLGVFLYLHRGWLPVHKKCLAIFLAAGVGFFLLTNVGVKSNETMAERVAQTVTLTSEEELDTNRTDIWRGAWAMIKEHGIIGTGIATFYLYYPGYRLPSDEMGAYMAHSDPIQFWAEMGLAAPLLFYAAMMGALFRTRRVLKTVPKTGDVRRVIVGATFCGLLAVLGHSHITFNLYNLSILFGVGFVMAGWFMVTRLPSDKPDIALTFPASFTPIWRGGLAVLPMALILYAFSAYVLSEVMVNRARDQIFAEKLFEFGDTLNLAHKIGFNGNYRAYLLAVNVPMGILQESGAGMDEAKQKEFYDQAISFLTRAKQMNPRSASASYYLGRLQELVAADIIPAGTPAREEYYREALALDPLHLGARMGLATILTQRGDKAGAVAVLKAGLYYQYRDPKAMAYYGQTMMMCVTAQDSACRAQAVQKMGQFKKLMDESYARQGVLPSQTVLGAEGALADKIK